MKMLRRGMLLTLAGLLLFSQTRIALAQKDEFNVLVEDRLHPDPRTIPGGQQNTRTGSAKSLPPAVFT
jgi:hypothetical protein